MSDFQSGILSEHRRFAIYLEAMCQGDIAAIRSGSQLFLTQLSLLQQRYPDAGLGAVIAFGNGLWSDLNPADRPPELKDFQPLGKGIAPATHYPARYADPYPVAAPRCELQPGPGRPGRLWWGYPY